MFSVEQLLQINSKDTTVLGAGTVCPDVSTKHLAPFSSDMKFRAITGWALLAKQREYWPPILVQGALIPQSFILPSGFLPEGEEGGEGSKERG